MNDEERADFYADPANLVPAGPARRRKPTLITDITYSHSVAPPNLTVSSIPYHTQVYKDDQGYLVFRQVNGGVVTINRYPIPSEDPPVLASS